MAEGLPKHEQRPKSEKSSNANNSTILKEVIGDDKITLGEKDLKQREQSLDVITPVNSINTSKAKGEKNLENFCFMIFSCMLYDFGKPVGALSKLYFC